MPKPAPRRLPSIVDTATTTTTTTTTASTPSNNPTTTTPKISQAPQQNHKNVTPTLSLDGDDAQVLPKPITNEEFQAMIPAHFLKNSTNTTTNKTNSNNINPESINAVTVTIKKPDPIELPPAPTGPGRVTETITKSTFTETVVTRITDNELIVPVIIEVCSAAMLMMTCDGFFSALAIADTTWFSTNNFSLTFLLFLHAIDFSIYFII